MDLEVVTVVVPSDPNIWDILTAIGTVGAVVAAVVLGLREQRRASERQRQELERLERDRADAVAARDRAEGRERRVRHEAQARRIAIWRQDEARWSPELPATQAVVGNYSDEPIFNVSTRIVHADDSESWPRPWHRILPGQQVFLFHDDRVIEEGESWRLEIQDASVRFRDMSGQEWIRYLDGRLDEIDPPDDPYTCTLQ